MRVEKQFLHGGDKVEKCPHCGSDTYYIKETATCKIVHYSKFDGSEADNSEMYDGMTHKLRSKFAFCKNCDRKLFRIA